jgi:hypothetical protein
MPADEADLELLKRFIERTATAMVERGWEVDPAGLPDGTSIFFGNFRRPVGAEWLATVEFISESGPVDGVELRLSGPRRFHRFEVTVGGEFGVRHLPTERLLRALEVRCEADVTRDLEDIFVEAGNDLPKMTDAHSVDQASLALVAAVEAHAMPFARQHADVDAAVAFIADGEQMNRSPEFEYLFVPALLAASGRHVDARTALATFRLRPKSGRPDEEEYARFEVGLSSWLDNPSSLS